MIRAISWLKSRFDTGARPTSSDFGDVLDSYVHISSQAAVDAQVVNQAIGAALAGLTGRNGDGQVNSLGDVFYVFTGYSESMNLSQKLAALTTAATWNGLPGKPQQLKIQWNEQVINCGTYDGFLPTNSRKWLLADVVGVTGAFILDLNVKRNFQPFSTTSTTSFEQGYIMDQIMQVKIATNPRISLT